MKAAHSLLLALGLVVLLLTGCQQSDRNAERGSLGGGPRRDRITSAPAREIELIAPSRPYRARAAIPARVSQLAQQAAQDRYQLEKVRRENFNLQELPVFGSSYVNLNVDLVRNEDVAIDGITLRLPEICMQAALPVEENSTVAIANGPCPANERISGEIILTLRALQLGKGYDEIPAIAKEFELFAGNNAIGKVRTMLAPFRAERDGQVMMTMDSSVQLVNLCEGEKYRQGCGLN